jgi:hypothetical protein
VRRSQWTGVATFALVAIVTPGLLALASIPRAAADSLASVTWSVSNAQTAQSTVAYSFGMKTTATGTIESVTVALPNGTSGNPGVSAVYGIGAGAVSIAGTTVTYTVATPASVPSGTSISLTFTGLKNTATAATYTSAVTIQMSAPATVERARSNAVTFGSSSTGITVVVGQTITFTEDTRALPIALDPHRRFGVVRLAVQTNDLNGYALYAFNGGYTVTPNY